MSIPTLLTLHLPRTRLPTFAFRAIRRAVLLLATLLPLPLLAAMIADVKVSGDSTTLTNVTGVVTSVGGATGRLQFTIQDATGGVIVDKGGTSYVQPLVGDSVTILQGTKTTFSGLIQLQPLSGADVQINSNGNPLPDPLRFSTLYAFSQADTNFVQSMYVHVKDLCLTGSLPAAAGSSTWLSSTATGNANYTVTDNGHDTAILRLPVDLAGTLATWRAKQRPAVSASERFDIVCTAGIFGGALQLQMSSPAGTTARADATGPVRVASGRAYNPYVGDFARNQPGDVRIAAFNVLNNLGSTSAAERAALTRLLRVLDPDIICFEEVTNTHSKAYLESELSSLVPLPAGQQWSVHIGPSDGFDFNVLASRHALSMQVTDTIPASDLRGTPAALFKPAGYRLGAYVMGLHLKCCTGGTTTQRRQKHCDAIAKWFGDLRTPGGNVDLPADTPVFAIGDFNLVDPDPQQPEFTLRTGDIQDEATYGPDIKGDWDNTDIADLKPADPFTGDLDTWPSGTINPTSRLDRIYYTDSRVSVAGSFILNTLSMTEQQLLAAGLKAADSATASDHLPVAIDVAQISFPVQISAWTLE